jgi:hypothetical protein
VRTSLATAGSAVLLLACNAEIDLAAPPPAVCQRDDLVVGDGAWLRPLGPLGGCCDNGIEVGVQPDGSIVVASSVVGNVSVDCIDLPELGRRDLLLATFRADGSVAWARRLGHAGGYTEDFFLGVDDAGVIHLVGTQATSFDEMTATRTLFARAISAEGDDLWSSTYDQDGASLHPDHVGFAGSGDAMLDVSFQGRLRIGEQEFAGGFDKSFGRVLITWSSDGTITSLDYEPPRSNPPFRTFALGRDGTLATATRVEGGGIRIEAQRDGEPLFSIDEPGAMGFNLFELEAGHLFTGFRNTQAQPLVQARSLENGTVLWDVPPITWMGERSQWPPYARHVARIANGWAFAASLLGTANLGSGPVSSAGDFDGLLITIGPRGEPLAARTIGAAGADSIGDLKAHSADNLVLTLSSDTPVDLGFGPSAPACTEDPCDHGFLAFLLAPR